MSVKEIASLAGGGMGIRFITQCVSSVLLSATNVFVGNTIGIEPMKLYYIYLIARPVIKAQKLLIQAENYAKLEEIESLYEDAKARHEKAMEDARIEAELAEAEKKAYEKKLKAK